MLDDPLVQSSLVPLAAAFAWVGLVRFVLRGESRALLAGAAVGLAFLVAHALIVGLPPLPPRASGHKVFYLAAAGLVVGLGLDLASPRRAVADAVCAAFAVVAVAWLGWPRLAAGVDAVGAARLLLVAAAAAFVLVRLHRLTGTDPSPVVMLLVTAVAAAAVAVLGRSASIGQGMGAIAAAAGGVMLWNWPRARDRSGGALVLGGGGALVALAAQSALYTPAPVAALLLALPLFFADRLAGRLHPSAGGGSDALATLIVAGLAALPAAVAVAIAYLLVAGETG
jgi:hypothetical protein